MSLLSCASILFLVMDPLGNIPLFVTLLKDVPPARSRRIILREHLFALGLFVFFLLCGRFLLDMLGIKDPSLSISGGIVLFLIAIKMVFPMKEGVFGDMPGGEPFFVPLATPLICGPSALTTVLILASKNDVSAGMLSAAVLLAWGGSLAILFNAAAIAKLMGERVVTAMERLMGMILITIAVQMLLNGLAQFFGR
ncbi:MAG: MarC family protein [Elusimicrobiota bacterium]|jgi:MarC family membrane protein